MYGARIKHGMRSTSILMDRGRDRFWEMDTIDAPVLCLLSELPFGYLHFGTSLETTENAQHEPG